MKSISKLAKKIAAKFTTKGGSDKIWTTATGEKIPVKRLGDDHLVNIIHHLERRKLYQDIQAQLHVDCLFGSAALEQAENVADFMEGQSVDDRFPIYADLMAEARRRKLVRRMIYVN